MARYSPISLFTTGKFEKTAARLEKYKKLQILAILNRYGERGVLALAAATPVESGETAAAWYYTTVERDGQFWLDFHNSHVEDGVPIAIILQYGHGTRTGGYVLGRDYINPVVKPLFDEILSEVMKEVRSL